MLRSARVLSLALAFAVVGCGRSESRFDEEEDRGFIIPVGAEVTVSVGECLAGGPPLHVCPDYDLATLLEASISNDDFELGEGHVEAGAAFFRVRAKDVGTGTLKVEYVDERGARQTAEVDIRAVKVTETQVSVLCDNHTWNRVYPVAAGSRFGVSIEARSGTRRLSVGDLSLVDAPGFTLVETVDGKAEVTAPAEPGTYSWTLAGGGTVDFIVYAPETLQLTLAEEPARGRTPRAIVLGSKVGELPVCVRGRDERVSVTVTGEGCAPLLSGVEVSGPMPLNLAGGDFKFELVGRDTCEVDARLGDGRGVTQSFSGGGDEEGTPPVLGTVISDGGTELVVEIPRGGTCPSSVSDGDCEYPWFLDGDCYIDSDWRIVHSDPTATDGGVLGEEDSVGVGLTTKLQLNLTLGLSPIPISLGPPQHLTFEQDPAWDWTVFPPRPSAGLALEDLRCVDARVVMAVKPLAEGEHGLAFHAENLDDTGELDVIARKVDRIDYSLRAEDGGPVRSGPSVELFVRSKASLTARYTRASGTVLHGTAPLRITSDVPEARSSVSNPDALASGAAPHTLTVSSSLAPETLTIQVRDAAAITGIQGFEAQSLRMGLPACVKGFVPLGEGGVAILGRPPTRPRVTLSGDSLVVSRKAFSDGLCLEGFAPGSSTVQLTWGSATVERDWTVAPPSP